MAFLDWSKTGSIGPPEPCVLCTKPSIVRSPRGKPCHMTCAAAYLDRQDEAKAERERVRQAEAARSHDAALAIEATAQAKQLREQARTSGDDHTDQLLADAVQLEENARQLRHAATHDHYDDDALTLTLE